MTAGRRQFEGVIRPPAHEVSLRVRLKMPEVYPRSQVVRFDPQLNEFVNVPGLSLTAQTLGEALVEVERITGIYVVPHEPPKYFRFYLQRNDPDFSIIDIHVLREEIEICVKQDLEFKLLDTDKVIFGHLAC
jgi:hypothetical protein